MIKDGMSPQIDSLRDQIDQIDRTILELIKKRMDVSSEIGRAKLNIGLPVRNYDREKICLENARKIASSLNISPQLAEEIQIKLIQGSVISQEKDRVRLSAVHNAKKALVIGGAGKMGNWFSNFLYSQGFFVRILDPKESPDFDQIDSLKDAVDYDLIVVAAPLQESNRILIELARLQPSGLVFDIASLKGPLKEGLTAMVSTGLKVTSLHPMFGPDTELLSGRHVIVINLGNDDANMEVEALFTPTAATIVQMDADDHDRSIAFLLGLSHALNIVFSKVLSASGESAPRLEELSSTTFDAQSSVARRVARENPKLYFEIQALNPFGDLSLSLLEDASRELSKAVAQKDEQKFTEMMQAGKNYYQSHREKGKSP